MFSPPPPPSQTIRSVPHPRRPDLQLLKVQQLHYGVPVWGHTFVVGRTANGSETEEGTHGAVVLGLPQALPSVTPTMSADQVGGAGGYMPTYFKNSKIHLLPHFFPA